jgi:hypothetical protein
MKLLGYWWSQGACFVRCIVTAELSGETGIISAQKALTKMAIPHIVLRCNK